MQFTENTPLYEQIANVICSKILNNTFKEGDAIPSIRDIAVTFEVNPNTAARTIQYLNDRGIVDKKRGLGMFVNSGAKNVILKDRTEVFWNEIFPSFLESVKELGISKEEIMNKIN